MKIKTKIKIYDVESLQGIDEGVTRMTKRVEKLSALCVFLDSKIKEARENGFRDVNTDRAEELIREYLKKLQYAQNEYSELSASVKEYVLKIEDIWNSWR